jgi:hypothetical protein
MKTLEKLNNTANIFQKFQMSEMWGGFPTTRTCKTCERGTNYAEYECGDILYTTEYDGCINASWSYVMPVSCPDFA